MAKMNKEEKAMQEIKNWINQHPFRIPSTESKDWLRSGCQKGDFSDGNLIEAGLYAFRKAESAVAENNERRKSLNKTWLLTPHDVTTHFADVNGGDLDPNLTMITEDNRKLVDWEVVKDSRHLRTIAVWAKIYHRATDENLVFKNTFRAMMRTQAWFEDSNRRYDRLGRNTNELDEPWIFTPTILKKLVFYGRDSIVEKRKQFIEFSTQARTEFPCKIRIPNLPHRVFHVQPRPDPDLYSMAADPILLYSIEPEQDGDSEDDKKQKRRQRRLFFQSLAILAWKMHEIEAATFEVTHALRGMRAMYRR